MANSDTGDLTWGHLDDTETYGRKSEEDQYIEVDKLTVNEQYNVEQEASHCLIFARSNAKVFDVYSARAVILMHMRFDGYIGFPGGLVDPGEEDVDSLNRELVEEINLDLSKHRVTLDNHVISHYNPRTRLVLHFYALEVSLEELREVERRCLQAKDYGSEVLGTFSVPLYTMGDGIRGLPTFLKHQFIGNARDQFLYAVRKFNIMKQCEIEKALPGLM